MVTIGKTCAAPKRLEFHLAGHQSNKKYELSLCVYVITTPKKKNSYLSAHTDRNCRKYLRQKRAG